VKGNDEVSKNNEEKGAVVVATMVAATVRE